MPLEFYLVNLTKSTFPEKVQQGITMIENLKIVKARAILVSYSFHLSN